MLNWEKICSWCINIYFWLIPKVTTLLTSQVNVSGWRQIIDLLAGSETWGQSSHPLFLMLQISKCCQPPCKICFFVCCLFVAQTRDRQARYMLLKSISAAVSRKSQQRLAFGCQLKEDTNCWYSACIWKLRCFMWLFCSPMDRRVRLPFPDSSQWGVCRVDAVMA